MSGFVGSAITGAVGSSFLGSLQTASFRGVPFKVETGQVRKGRRQAIHEYAFRDGGWAEDMGRSLRTYSFTGHLIGDLAPVMQLALDTVLELPGSGLLIHPSIGAVQASVVSAATAINHHEMRVIKVAFTFVEDGQQTFPIALIATAISVVLLVAPTLSSCNASLGGTAGPPALLGSAVLGEGVAVVDDFIADTVLGGDDATAIVGLATALAPPDAETSYGRYAAGSATLLLPDGTTVASLQASLAEQRAAIETTAAIVAATAATYSSSTDLLTPLSDMLEALRGGISDPAAQVRVLLNLGGFTYSDRVSGIIGIEAGMAIMRDAMAAACRRAALVSLAQASSTYQPSSYDDAVTVRDTISDALSAEITIAGDAGDDDAYSALKQLRAAVIRDLTVRGANLPTIVTATFATSLPTLVVAQQLYKDASRSDQIAAETNCIHPAFCPTSMQVLAR